MMMICWVYSSTKKRDVVHSGNCCFHIGCLFLWPQKLTPLRPFLFHPPFVLSRAESYIVLTKSMWFLPVLPSSRPYLAFIYSQKVLRRGLLTRIDEDGVERMVRNNKSYLTWRKSLQEVQNMKVTLLIVEYFKILFPEAFSTQFSPFYLR